MLYDCPVCGYFTGCPDLMHQRQAAKHSAACCKPVAPAPDDLLGITHVRTLDLSFQVDEFSVLAWVICYPPRAGQRAFEANAQFFVNGDSLPAGGVNLYELSPDFNARQMEDAYEEFQLTPAQSGLRDWWLDELKRNPDNPHAAKYPIAAITRACLEQLAPDLFADIGNMYLFPAPIGAASEEARLKLVAHYEKTLGSQEVARAEFLKVIPGASFR